MTEYRHDPETCLGLREVRAVCDELTRWQKNQNGTLGRLEAKLDTLSARVEQAAIAEATRRGAEGMLKWILGFAGLSTIISLASLLWKAAG
jgi:hypothetical protein